MLTQTFVQICTGGWWWRQPGLTTSPVKTDGLGSSIDSLAGVEGSDNWLAVAGLKLNIMCSYQPPLPLPASPS